MFLDTMSPEAIIKEARRDTTTIQNKRDFFINTHRREILFAKKFPVSYRIEWKSPLNTTNGTLSSRAITKKNGKTRTFITTPLTKPTVARALYFPSTT